MGLLVITMKCSYCHKKITKSASAENRAMKGGYKLYCNRICSGLGRRTGKTKKEKVKEKRIYDAEYRAKNIDLLKKKKSVYFKNTYDPIEASKKRALTMDRHVEYCRNPEYKAKKKNYDRIYKAKKSYGKLFEHQLLILKIFDVVNGREGRYKIKYEAGCLNKTQKRKRENEKINSEEFERNTLGDIE